MFKNKHLKTLIKTSHNTFTQKKFFTFQNDFLGARSANFSTHTQSYSQFQPISNDYSNIPDSISQKIGKNIHRQDGHPLSLLKNCIFDYFNQVENRDGTKFHCVDNLSPYTSTIESFDRLLIDKSHVTRSKSDTYYVNETHVLRPHMTAHSPTLLDQGYKAFLTCGDVYRRDEVDATHYPVFHQIDGVRVISRNEYDNFLKSDEYKEMQNTKEQKMLQKTDESIIEVNSFEEYVAYDLQKTLGGMAKFLFSNDTVLKWNLDTFPFTHPSYELEILHNSKLLELLGCGVLKYDIMKGCGYSNQEEYLAWAFGIGLERVAMKYFEIPDIRLFWSEDARFLNQFKSNGLKTKFEPYSKYPPCYKDISFWVPQAFHENDFYETVREIGGDLIESVEIVDEFFHPKKQKQSLCFRINYRSMDRSLTNNEINDIQDKVISESVSKLKCEIRDGSKV